MSQSMIESLSQSINHQKIINKRLQSLSNERKELNEHLNTIKLEKHNKRMQNQKQIDNGKRALFKRVMQKHELDITQKILKRQQTIDEQISKKREYRNLMLNDWYTNYELDRQKLMHKKEIVIAKHWQNKTNDSQIRTRINSSVMTNY